MRGANGSQAALGVWLLVPLLALVPLSLAACGDDDSADVGAGGSTNGAAGDAGAAGADDGIYSCPDPNDTTVHYVTTNIDECPIESLMCAEEQYGFHNACGCGCIDKGNPMCIFDPSTNLYLISGDPAECGDIMPDCPFGQRPFNNTCGCGCADE